MTLKERLQALLRERDELIAGTAAEQEEILLRTLGDYLEDLTAVLGEQPTAEIAEQLLDTIEKRFEPILTTKLLDAYQEARNAEAEAAGVDAFVYLGPDDGVTRPFCQQLVGTWLTKGEIGSLDNGQTGGGTAFVTRGGYNCRHSWLALPTEEERAEFPHGDVASANALGDAR